MGPIPAIPARKFWRKCCNNDICTTSFATLKGSRGSFNNYVDQILPNFDPLNCGHFTWCLTFVMWPSMDFLLTSSPFFFTMAGLGPICPFIAKIPIFDIFILILWTYIVAHIWGFYMPSQSSMYYYIWLLRIGLNIGHFELFTSFIQILLICHFRKIFIWVPKFKFKWLKMFQLRCWSMNFRGSVGYG